MHTPAPWKRVHIGDHDTVEAVVKKGEAHLKNNGYQVASCFGPDQTFNAALIAAAPELLQACKDGLVIVLASGMDDTDQVVVDMKKAIAKAEGKS